MLSVIEERRLKVSKNTGAEKKSQLGQYFTPAKTAQFMASLFTVKSKQECRLLDAGAGIGSLSCAFLERCINAELNFRNLEVTAYELDACIHKELNDSILSYKSRLAFVYKLFGDDFIEQAVNKIQFEHSKGFTHAILNPPYKKINSSSSYRLLLRKVGIETVNLYSAFVALTLALLESGGQIVAIIPRSFCNGPYYRPFRKYLLKRAAIKHIHLFDSRNKAFKDDDVLQENIILLLERDGLQGEVTVTTSTDHTFHDFVTFTHPFKKIVFDDDPEHFIHVPTSHESNIIELSTAISYSLDDIDIRISTGPVVDFRLKKHLREMPEIGTVPLLYPAHFARQTIEWPKPDIKKPNAIQRNDETEKWLYPNGFYCVVRRFSSKEEKRRIVASVIQPHIFGDVEMIGIENHLNVFHENKHGMSKELAYGLAMYLNTTGVDENFRRSSGHTQINATDLKSMKYPSRKTLIAFGKWAIRHSEPTQNMIDQQLRNLIK